MRGAETEKTARARRLRREATAAEQRLWQFLRGRQISNAKFVRQEPIGPFFADFACRKSKLVIEIDGATHSTPEELEHDARRTAFLTSQGYRVIRFSNEQILGDLDPVIHIIIQHL